MNGPFSWLLAAERAIHPGTVAARKETYSDIARKSQVDLRMSLPDYVAPVVAASGLPAALFIAIRFGSDAVLRLLAGAVAVLCHDEKRGERCLEVLRILRKKDDPPPADSRCTPRLANPPDAQRAPEIET